MTVNVAQLLDEGRWTTYQKLLIVGTALTIILDGIDNQLLVNAVPAMMGEWSLPRAAFTTVLAAGPFGMVIGGTLGGMLGDRIGRRSALMFSVLAFAALTLAIATVHGLTMLGVLRFFAGLGLGGAMPNAAALASEYVPRRKRPFAVTLTIVCIPLGGTIAAFLSGQVLPGYGWRTLFTVGGIIPIVLALVLFKVLPESPRYLAGDPRRWPELVRILRRIGHQIPPNAVFIEAGPDQSAAAVRSRASLLDLFTPGLRRDTLGLFVSFFFCLLALYVGVTWIVTILTGAHFSQTYASNALLAFNFGGVGGAIAGALIIQRLGSRITMLGMSALAVISALVMAATPLDPQRAFTLIVMFTLTGGLLNAVQTTMYALAAHVYPTHIRGRGVGTAVAIGRIGNVLAPYVGNFALDRGGSAGYFSVWAMTMTIVFCSLATVRRHIESTSSHASREDATSPAFRMRPEN